MAGDVQRSVAELLDKVEEVLNNNDWPTEDGLDNSFGDSPIRELVADIRDGLGLLG